MRFDPNDYVDVSDRITRFWQEYPDGAIRTELASPASSFTEVVFRAEVYKQRDHANPDAVGYAAEKPGNGANQTSWHENCETSAIGRALANMGYATSQKDRPSRQEMQKVQRAAPAQTQQNGAQRTQAPTAAALVETDRNKVSARYFAVVNNKGLTDDERKILQRIAFGVESSKDLTIPQMQQLIERIESRSVTDLRDAVQRQLDLDKAVVLPSEMIAR